MVGDNSTIIDPVPPDSDTTPVPNDPARCSLLGTTGIIVQAMMGVMVITSLLIKKRLERRKRSWRIWSMDIGKQLVGQAVVHGLNLLISDQVANVGHNNPCSLYFLNVLIDTTLGVGVIYISLKIYTWYFSKYLGYDGFVSGKYGHPPQSLFWWKQLVTYLLSIITMKLLVLLPITLPRISDTLLQLGHWLLEWLPPSAQVIFVMALFPLVMNVVQFCLVDQVIKGGDSDVEEEGRDDGEGYSIVPDWEGDVESRREQNGTPKPVAKPENLIPPTSPLLSPRVHGDYGSTTPSPIGSPTKSLGGGNVWTRIMGKRELFVSGEEKEGKNVASGSESTHRASAAGERSLSVPLERGERSNAPSPESSYRPPDDLSPHEARPLGPSEETPHWIGSPYNPSDTRRPSTEWGTSSALSQGRRLTSEISREARMTLSPPDSPVVTEQERDAERGEEVLLDVWRGSSS